MSQPRLFQNAMNGIDAAQLSCTMWMRAPVQSASVAARFSASTATTSVRAARCDSGSLRPAAFKRFCRQNRIGEFSAWIEQRRPSSARISNPSSTAPSDGHGLSPVVLPRNSFVPIIPASAIGRSWSRLCSPRRP
jgi:hypothetical protein